MKRQIEILAQHKKNGTSSFDRVYDAMVRRYGKAKVDNALAKLES